MAHLAAAAAHGSDLPCTRQNLALSATSPVADQLDSEPNLRPLFHTLTADRIVSRMNNAKVSCVDQRLRGPDLYCDPRRARSYEHATPIVGRVFRIEMSEHAKLR